MVVVLRWCLRVGTIALGFAATNAALSAQNIDATSLATLQENAAKRTTEWNMLATSLEQRVVRLLPCDARVPTSIEEVSRAADARTVAQTTYWNVVSAKSKAQIEAIRGLLMQEEARADEWAKDRAAANLDSATTSAQAATLTPSIRQLPALANPQKNLEAIARMYRTLEGQAQEREASGGELVDNLRELFKAAQARQAAIEEQMKAISADGQRWSGYYASRQERAQVECSIVNPGAAAARPAPTTPRPLATPPPARPAPVPTPPAARPVPAPQGKQP